MVRLAAIAGKSTTRRDIWTGIEAPAEMREQLMAKGWTPADGMTHEENASRGVKKFRRVTNA
jgi:hypothetical protein